MSEATDGIPTKCNCGRPGCRGDELLAVMKEKEPGFLKTVALTIALEGGRRLVRWAVPTAVVMVVPPYPPAKNPVSASPVVDDAAKPPDGKYI